MKTLVAVALAACAKSPSTVSDAASPAPDAASPTETRYLGFQIFEGTPDPATPFDSPVAYTPAAGIASDFTRCRTGASRRRTRRRTSAPRSHRSCRS